MPGQGPVPGALSGRQDWPCPVGLSLRPRRYRCRWGTIHRGVRWVSSGVAGGGGGMPTCCPAAWPLTGWRARRRRATRCPLARRAGLGRGKVTGCLLGGRGLAAAVAAAAAAAGRPGWWRCGRCRCRWRLGADGAAGGSDEFAAGGVAVGRVFGQRLTDDLIDGAGRVGCSELGVVGISSTCAQMTAASTSLAKGTRPVTHSYITQPSE